MNDTERAELKELLEAALLKLHEEIAELEELTQPIGPENAIGRVSRMDAINNRSVNEAGLRQRRHKLRGIENNLKTIDAPQFGQCKSCGKEIPLARLKFIPETSFCTPCARRV